MGEDGGYPDLYDILNSGGAMCDRGAILIATITRDRARIHHSPRNAYRLSQKPRHLYVSRTEVPTRPVAAIQACTVAALQSNNRPQLHNRANEPNSPASWVYCLRGQ